MQVASRQSYLDSSDTVKVFVFAQIHSYSRCIFNPFIHFSELVTVDILKAAEHATSMYGCAPSCLEPGCHGVQPENRYARMQGASAQGGAPFIVEFPDRSHAI